MGEPNRIEILAGHFAEDASDVRIFYTHMNNKSKLSMQTQYVAGPSEAWDPNENVFIDQDLCQDTLQPQKRQVTIDVLALTADRIKTLKANKGVPPKTTDLVHNTIHFESGAKGRITIDFNNAVHLVYSVKDKA